MATDVPTRVRKIVRQREAGANGSVPRCLWCGAPNASEYAHRRTRAVRDEHRHCPCNGAYLCSTCHRKCHGNPGVAHGQGFMVSRYEPEPSKVPVRTWYGVLYLLCDGNIQFESKEDPHDARRA